ncbi:MAG: type II secretion system F family protein [Lachnospiraceae bacterium]|nr:type II secretion system F family protein [Candidatus Merdinaster equi]
MANFSYEAIQKSDNKIKKGSIEASSLEIATAEIKRQGMTLVTIKEQGALNKDLNIDIGGKPKPRDLSVFCHQFVSMVRAGVAMLDALRMLAESTENKLLKKTLEEVKKQVEKGETLSEAMSQYPKVFPPLMVSMAAAGEASGKIDVSMERMSKQLERATKTSGLIKKAMMYPIVVLIVMIIVVIVMLVGIIPSYTKMFKEMDAEMPGITMAVQAMSDFLIANWPIVLIVVIGLVVFFSWFKKTDKGKHIFGKIALTIPAVKNLIIKTATAQMARTLGTLVASGIPLVDAVDIVSDTMTNIYFKEAMIHAKEEITIGQPLSVPLEESKLFPPMSYYMIRIGEETGNSEEMMDKLADYYEEEVEMAVQTLLAAMEPAIIVVMAGVVGLLIAACFAPMLSMYDALGNL